MRSSRLVAVMMIAVSYLLSQLTAGQDMKVIKDLGLAAMSLFGLFIAVRAGLPRRWPNNCPVLSVRRSHHLSAPPMFSPGTRSEP